MAVVTSAVAVVESSTVAADVESLVAVVEYPSVIAVVPSAVAVVESFTVAADVESMVVVVEP